MARSWTDNDVERLVKLAKEAADAAYAPYSKFKVGAALQTKSGAVFHGCNVENANYSLTLHAEHNAIGQMVVAGVVPDIDVIVIYTPTNDVTPTGPCGSCRQALYEFSPDCTVISVCDNPAASLRIKLSKLLPHAFGPADLGK